MILLIETTVSHFVTLVASGVEHDSMTVRELGLERMIWYQDKESTQDTLQTDLSEQAFPYIYTITSFSRFLPTDTYPKSQNSANDANANVAPKLSLKATLSSIADLRSIPFTYFCIRDVGTILYPLEARN